MSAVNSLTSSTRSSMDHEDDYPVMAGFLPSDLLDSRGGCQVSGVSPFSECERKLRRFPGFWNRSRFCVFLLLDSLRYCERLRWQRDDRFLPH